MQPNFNFEFYASEKSPVMLSKKCFKEYVAPITQLVDADARYMGIKRCDVGFDVKSPKIANGGKWILQRGTGVSIMFRVLAILFAMDDPDMKDVAAVTVTPERVEVWTFCTSTAGKIGDVIEHNLRKVLFSQRMSPPSTRSESRDFFFTTNHVILNTRNKRPLRKLITRRVRIDDTHHAGDIQIGQLPGFPERYQAMVAYDAARRE